LDRTKTAVRIAREAGIFLVAALLVGLAIGAFASLVGLDTALTYAISGAALGVLVVAGIYWIIGRRWLAFQDLREVHSYEPAVITDEGEDRVGTARIDPPSILRRRDEHELRGGSPIESSARRAISRSAQGVDRINVGVGVQGFDPKPKQPA
jgi:hypothetical protein